MKISEVEYIGDLRCRTTHIRSGNVIETVAPPDNNGKGDAFSPTDLVATMLANCMMTIVGIFCDARDIKIDLMKAEVSKIMTPPPRKIAEVHVNLTIHIPDLTDAMKKLIVKAAHTCPVALSLSDKVKQVIEITFK